jgi:transcription initiation factor TFIID subunit 5
LLCCILGLPLIDRKVREPVCCLLVFLLPNGRQRNTHGMNNSSSRTAGGNTGSAGNAGGNSNAGAAAAGPPAPQLGGDHTTIVLEYLVKRGYTLAAQALRQEIDPNNAAARPSSAGGAGGGGAVSQETFERRNLGQQQQQQQRKASTAREDPLPWKEGLNGLRAFVFGSLDIHRPELLPVLLPVYVHSFLDLLLLNYRDQADSILTHLQNDCSSTSPSTVRLLSGLKTSAEAEHSELVQRWRRERYVVKMTRRGWSLLLGWLQGGSTGTSLGTGDQGTEKGREKMLGIINERVRIDVVNPKSAQAVNYHNRLLANGGIALEGGLESELEITPTTTTTTAKNGEKDSSNTTSTSTTMVRSTSGDDTALEPLKLGMMPMDPKLEKEVQRSLISQGISTSASNNDSSDASASASVQTPTTDVQSSDLPPYPPSFRTIDVKREVEKVREARKRIKLGPPPQQQRASAAKGGEKGEADKEALMQVVRGQSGTKWNLPSVCMFTLHDTGDT